MRAALNHGVAHANQRVMQAVLSPRTAVGFNSKVMSCFPMVEVFGQDTVLDEHLFSGVDALIINRISTVAAHHRGVVDHSDDLVSDFLTEFPIQAGISSSDQIGLARVPSACECKHPSGLCRR